MDWGISQEGCFDRVIIVQGASRLPGQEARLCRGECTPHFPCSRRGGHSHVRARGRYLWCKDSSPLDPHQKHGGRHRPPYPLWAQRGGLRPSPLETPPGGWTGLGPRLWNPAPRSWTKDAGERTRAGCAGCQARYAVTVKPQTSGCKEDTLGFSFRCRSYSFVEPGSA